MYCYLEKRGVVEGFPFVAFNSRYYLFRVGYFVPQPQIDVDVVLSTLGSVQSFSA